VTLRDLPWKPLPKLDRLHRYCVIGNGPSVGKPLIADNIRTLEAANVLSAAPELLEAVRALLPRGWRDGSMDHMPGVSIARMALAKAEGRLVRMRPGMEDKEL
jgi:hypothetical protein